MSLSDKKQRAIKARAGQSFAGAHPDETPEPPQEPREEVRTFRHRHLTTHGMRATGMVWPTGPEHEHNLDGTGQPGHIHSPKEPSDV